MHIAELNQRYDITIGCLGISTHRGKRWIRDGAPKHTSIFVSGTFMKEKITTCSFDQKNFGLL
jgi:hypothetical protein